MRSRVTSSDPSSSSKPAAEAAAPSPEALHNLGLEPSTAATTATAAAAQPPPTLPPRDALGYGFRELSFLEPHKRFQNSCSIFQKRGEGYAEPVLTSYP